MKILPNKISSIFKICLYIFKSKQINLINFSSLFNLKMLNYIYSSNLVKILLNKIEYKTFKKKKFKNISIHQQKYLPNFKISHTNINQIIISKKRNIKTLKNIFYIDIIQTIKYLKLASSFLKIIKKQNKKILFVCTEKLNNINNYIKYSAQLSNSFYITNSWINGLLTNWKTTKNLINNYNNKSTILLNKKKKFKINNLLFGIKNMNTIPDLIIFTHQLKDLLPIKETLRLGIPTIGLININNNPNLITYPIPINTDSIKITKYILTYLIKFIK
jgi:small subunit ribosomal protein S2